MFPEILLRKYTCTMGKYTEGRPDVFGILIICYMCLGQEESSCYLEQENTK